MKNELDHIRKRLKVEGEKTIAFFEGLSPTDWDHKVYTTGSGWRVREVLAHFISAERAYQQYLLDVLEGGIGAPNDLDIDQFNEADVATMEDLPPGQLLDTYRLVREETIHFTELMEEDDLMKMAQHPWFESKDIGWYLKLLYRHNAMHKQDILKSLNTSLQSPPSIVNRTGKNIDPRN